MANSNTSVIIPAFNEEKGLDLTLSKLKNISTSGDYEIIVVDDGSTDNTSAIAKRYGVKVIRNPYNKGYGASLKTGIKSVFNVLINLFSENLNFNLID